MTTPDTEKTKEELLREVMRLRQRVSRLESRNQSSATDWTIDLFRSLVDGVEDYAIFMLDPAGHVATWNSGAERLWGYSASEILGRHYSCFYTAADIALDKPAEDLRLARGNGKYSGDGWRVRKEGSRFLANFVMTALRDQDHYLYGFARVVRDVTWQELARAEIERANADLERRVLERTAELTAANGELAAFGFSVSHDLRSPLRAIDGFSKAVIEDHSQSLDPAGIDYLERIRSEAKRMGELIDGLLDLSRVGRSELSREDVDLSLVVRQVIYRLQCGAPHRQVQFLISDGATVCGDERLLRIAIENLLENAWKFTSSRAAARIEFGLKSNPGDPHVWFVRDNGVGFDMDYSKHLFGAFQRLHTDAEFPGTGIGLATVQRIIHRHGGRVWAEAAPDQGATFYFTI